MFNGDISHHSIFCILPPHILSSIAQNGTPQQRSQALQNLGTDQTFRSLRTMQNLVATTQTRGVAPLTAEGHPQRIIYDAHHTYNLPGEIVRTEGSAPTGDAAVDEAYDGLGDTYNLYWNAFHRD